MYRWICIVLGPWLRDLVFFSRITLCLWLEHKTGLIFHLILKRVHGTHWILLFRRWFTITWLHPDILLHLLFPLCGWTLIISWKFSKAYDGCFFCRAVNLRLILARPQTITRIKQKVILLIQMGYISWDSHRTQVHRVEIFLLCTGALIPFLFFLYRHWCRGALHAFFTSKLPHHHHRGCLRL